MSDGLRYPHVPRGKKATISGRNGTGKTTAGLWIARHSPGTWVILDTKGDPDNFGKVGVALEGLPTASRLDKALASRAKFVVVRPSYKHLAPDILDDFITQIHLSYSDIGLFIDELYSVHNNGRMGRGLSAWLTQGRALKQSFIGLTQRPAWISGFCYSEADYIGSFDLTLRDDRKRLVAMTGRETFWHNEPTPHTLRWYTVAQDRLTRFAPLPMSK